MYCHPTRSASIQNSLPKIFPPKKNSHHIHAPRKELRPRYAPAKVPDGVFVLTDYDMLKSPDSNNFAHSVKMTLSNSDVRSKFSKLGSGTQVFQLSISWLLSSVPPKFVWELTDINTLFVSSESTESSSTAGFRWRGDVSDRNSSA